MVHVLVRHGDERRCFQVRKKCIYIALIILIFISFTACALQEKENDFSPESIHQEGNTKDVVFLNYRPDYSPVLPETLEEPQYNRVYSYYEKPEDSDILYAFAIQLENYSGGEDGYPVQNMDETDEEYDLRKYRYAVEVLSDILESNDFHRLSYYPYSVTEMLNVLANTNIGGGIGNRASCVFVGTLHDVNKVFKGTGPINDLSLIHIWILENYENDFYNKEDIRALCYETLHKLIELTAGHGFEGNLWHNYLTFLIVNHENAYSTACEIKGAVEGSINAFAIHDFEIFKELFDFDLTLAADSLDISILKGIMDYKRVDDGSKVFNTRVRDRICNLSIRLEQMDSAEEFQREVTEFYKDFGVGKLGLHKAFRIEHAEGGAKIVPITNIAHVHLDDLIGYEIAKEKLIANTEAFVKGKKANNCLLFGDAGTGKSTSIKAIVNQYYDQGLRMIEVYKHQFQDLNSLITQIKNRNYKFIIYMDDLSFEEFEIEYKYLKAVIEGCLLYTS